MKTENILLKAGILIFLLSLFSQVNAQSHNVTCPACKHYQRPADAKNVVNTGCICEACRAKDKKEREAKQAEDKRRNDILIAKQKSEAAERDRIAREKKAKEDAENRRKQENIARVKKESDDAIRRAGEIRNKYKQLNNIKGDEYEEEIAGLEAHNDREYFGVKLNGDFLWRKPTDNLPISITKIMGTNYFIAYNGSKGKLYNFYGKPILIEGEEWFDEVSFNKESKIFEFKMFDEKPVLVSSEILCYWTSKYIPFEGVYNSIDEIKAIYEENLKIADAIRKKSLAESGGGSVICAVSGKPYATKGKYIATDAKLKILKNQTGYFAR